MTLGKKFTGVLAAAVILSLPGSGVSAANFDKMQDGVTIGGVDVSGMTFDEARQAVLGRVQELQGTKVTVTVGENEIKTTAAELGVQWKNRAVINDALSFGNAGNIVTRYKQKKDLQQEKRDYELILNANETILKGFINDECMQYEADRVETSISADGSGGVDLTVGKDGLKINVEESVDTLTSFLEHDLDGETGSVALAVEIDPAASAEDIETITDLLGTYTTPYWGSNEGRNTNVERGAELINGHLLKPGETFSVCDHLVPFSAENGYEMGGAYENGRVVQEYGGGICQVSTTLYNALLLAEVEILERHNHTMSVTYVPTSMDAAIAEGNFDLIFRNNYDTPIFISGYASNGELTFNVWGKDTRPEDRYIWFESMQTSELEAPTHDLLLPAGDKEAGYVNQVQTQTPGSTAILYKYVSYRGETTCEVVNESTYDPTPNTYEFGTIGATDALLNAIYNDDLASAQLAATGVITYTSGNGVQTGGLVDPTLQPILDPIRNIYVDPMTGQPIDNSYYTGGTTTYVPQDTEPVYDPVADVYYDDSTVVAY